MEVTMVKSFLESIYCSTHKQHPHVSVDDNDHACVECCCMQFQKQCQYLIKLLSRPNGKMNYSEGNATAVT